MTHQMLGHAKKGEWDELIEIEKTRQKIVNDLFSDASAVDPETPKGQQIREILKINQEIQALATEAKNSVRDELVEINKIRNQAKAYQGK